MANITVLDQNTINQIAAGEVVERPASVVKELLENAIDAKATAVTVETRDGGISFIRVTDNGCGIPRDQLALAFLRHSTSKIQSIEDLLMVSSLGFRGEALSSIAAISQVELITKTSVGLTGSRYLIEGGVEKANEEVGAPEGTTFIARNIFYNTPARKKFLKTAATEGAHVADLVEKLALSHPEVSIRLIQNGQTRLHTSGNHHVKDLIYTVFGRDIAANLLPVEANRSPVSITGFIGKPVIARGNRNYENYFINGRFIKSNLISRAIEDAYKPFMMQHKYPFTLLHFQIQPDFLDVNVHPTKMELRFKDGEMIYRLVYDAVALALSQKELIPQVRLEKQPVRETSFQQKSPAEKPEPFEQRRREVLESQKTVPVTSYGEISPLKPSVLKETLSKDTKDHQKPLLPRPAEQTEDTAKPATAMVSAPPTTQSGEKEQLDLFEAKLLSPKSRKHHRLLGQLFDTYWLVQFEDSLYIIDQHAAHEKVLYEKTMDSLRNRDYTSQLLNPPIILTLSRNEEVLLLRYMEHFTSIGFEIEHFGGKEYAVRGVPDNLFSIARKELLMEMIDHLSEDISKSNPELIFERVASMSCKAAVKGNQTLSATEAEKLIDQLLMLKNPYACPHGRPTIISMSRHELEKKFKRIV